MESKLFTKLVIMYSMPKAPKEFVEWFRERAETRGWTGVREIARGIGVSHPLVSEILAGEKPSFDTCVKIADTFAIGLTSVVVMAGLIPTPPGMNQELIEWSGLFELMTDSDQEEMFTIGRMKAKRGKNAKEKTR